MLVWEMTLAALPRHHPMRVLLRGTHEGWAECVTTKPCAFVQTKRGPDDTNCVLGPSSQTSLELKTVAFGLRGVGWFASSANEQQPEKGGPQAEIPLMDGFWNSRFICRRPYQMSICVCVYILSYIRA